MCKWRPQSLSKQDEWSNVFQIVVPQTFQKEILKLAHDCSMAGHLGVNKTHNRILQNFYLPGLKKDVVVYCRTFHVCQLAGKPNQSIPVAPLHPIPAFEEPFARVLVDCVGPLPKPNVVTNIYWWLCALLLVVQALLKFFSMFGLPKTVQSDQGTNFMSRTFKQVLDQLGISHCHSSAYHPESQGALERFNQTLKAMLKTYCLEDEGVHLMLFAAREAVQDSLGFSPAQLVFGHNVHGPLKLLKEKWLAEATYSSNLLDYVSHFRYRLSKACEIDRSNLAGSQKKKLLGKLEVVSVWRSGEAGSWGRSGSVDTRGRSGSADTWGALEARALEERALERRALEERALERRALKEQGTGGSCRGAGSGGRCQWRALWRRRHSIAFSRSWHWRVLWRRRHSIALSRG